MKDEEMAEKEYENLSQEKIEHYCDKAIYVTGFLAGLKAGRPQWHDLQKDPNDLPKVGVQVLSEQGTRVIYKGEGFNWVEYSPNADNIKLRKWEEPIAWCEIPTFDKEVTK